MDDPTCETCGTDDHLRGDRDGDVIHLTCDVEEINREWRHIRPGENPAG